MKNEKPAQNPDGHYGEDAEEQSWSTLLDGKIPPHCRTTIHGYSLAEEKLQVVLLGMWKQF